MTKDHDTSEQGDQQSQRASKPDNAPHLVRGWIIPGGAPAPHREPPQLSVRDLQDKARRYAKDLYGDYGLPSASRDVLRETLDQLEARGGLTSEFQGVRDSLHGRLPSLPPTRKKRSASGANTGGENAQSSIRGVSPTQRTQQPGGFERVFGAVGLLFGHGRAQNIRPVQPDQTIEQHPTHGKGPFFRRRRAIEKRQRGR